MKKKKLSIRTIANVSGMNVSLHLRLSYGYVEKHTDLTTQFDDDGNVLDVKEKVEKNYKPFDVATGLILPSGFWDKISKRAKGSEYEIYNQSIEDMKEGIQMLFTSISEAGQNMKPEKFKAKIYKHILKKEAPPKFYRPADSNEEEPEPELYFLDFINGEIAKERKHSKLGLIKIKEKSLNQYDSFVLRWKQFEDHVNQHYLCKELNVKIIEAFFVWLNSESPFVIESGGPYKLESLNTKKKGFNKYFEKARKKFHLKLELQKRTGVTARIKPPEKHIVYLSPLELDKVQAADLSEIKIFGIADTHLVAEVVRDYFIIACYSGGARYSDYKYMQLVEVIDNSYAIEFLNTKINRLVKAPAFKRVKSIFDKYDGVLPAKLPDNSRFNKILKEIIRAAKLDDKNKWEKMTSHTARKSFCTIMPLHFGWTVAQTMLCSHRTMAEYCKYVGNDMMENFLQLDKQLKAINQ